MAVGLKVDADVELLGLVMQELDAGGDAIHRYVLSKQNSKAYKMFGENSPHGPQHFSQRSSDRVCPSR